MQQLVEVVYHDGDVIARVQIPVRCDRDALVGKMAAMGGDVKSVVWPGSLSLRERQVVRCVRLGWTNRHIAQELGISEGTVKRHVSNVMAKCQLESRTQLALAFAGN